MDLKRILEGNLFYTSMTYKTMSQKRANLKISTYPPTILIWGGGRGLLGETPIYVSKSTLSY